MRTASIFCVLFVFVSSVRAENPLEGSTECQENEIFDKCYNNCEKICGPQSTKCSFECAQACRCADGFARNTFSGKCVKVAECPPECE
jgi:hypothetical protein